MLGNRAVALVSLEGLFSDHEKIFCRLVSHRFAAFSVFAFPRPKD
ncbi:hypothetical protein CEV33_2954 [Brucella grignonensis]|uniref:Uncharacterized protein n=1 Tax=Brucella grignonensis TaxID=94627 RepID=A0A256F302_9HYPH|nr:hypothetical protein CEV33_2954 [Brucella grignonensis]